MGKYPTCTDNVCGHTLLLCVSLVYTDKNYLYLTVTFKVQHFFRGVCVLKPVHKNFTRKYLNHTH